MVTILPWAVLGCSGARQTPETILGIQVVAIEADPPEPEPFQSLTLRAWVADANDRGADTLIWLCTPYEGRCLEAFPPGSDGLPLSVWARTGTALPTFEASSTLWPLFASIADSQLDLPEEVRGKLLVWALACAPGVCPIIDQVRADPASPSPAYSAAARALADPASWLEDLPRRQASVALKVVPVRLGSDAPQPEVDFPYRETSDTGDNRPPNRAPTLSLREATGSVRVFDIGDPDDDPLNIRSFTTAGGIYQEVRQDLLYVMRQAPLRTDRTGAMFVVLEDERGGTRVWSDHPSLDPCNQPFSAAIEPRGARTLPVNITRGDPIVRASVPIRINSGEPDVDAALTLTLEGVLYEPSSRLTLVEGPACTFRGTASFDIPIGPDAAKCDVLGQLATLSLDARDSSFGGDEATATAYRPVVADNDTFERFCREL